MDYKVYISGGMTGIEDFNYGAFDKASKLMKEKGIDYVNPFDVGRSISDELVDCTQEQKYDKFMKADIKALMDCNAIYLLDGWEKSKGATMEKSIADFFNMKVVYQYEDISILEKVEVLS